MNAGKSTMLLQANHNYQERGMNTVIYTSSVDDRYGKKEIVSRSYWHRRGWVEAKHKRTQCGGEGLPPAVL